MMHTTPKMVAVFVVVLAAVPVQAQQYRWTDANGRVHYTDTPPPARAKDVEKKNLNAGKPGVGPEPYALQVARKNAPVKLYTAPDCLVCNEARQMLNKRGIPFAEISITEAKQLEELKNLSGGTTVPVMLVGGSVERGYEAGAYNLSLDSAGYPKAGVLPPRDQPAPPPPKPPVPPKPTEGSPPGSPAAPAAPTASTGQNGR